MKFIYLLHSLYEALLDYISIGEVQSTDASMHSLLMFLVKDSKSVYFDLFNLNFSIGIFVVSSQIALLFRAFSNFLQKSS